jgi:ubiquinone/menaquinone biosynthesis C-methylase UbiE
MKRIREANVNTSEYFNKFATPEYETADLKRSGNRFKFDSVMNRIDKMSDILDIGCLNGNFYNFLKMNYFKVNSFTGLDFSEKLIARAKDRFPEQKWVVSDCYSLPFEDSVFDVVTLMEILEHVENPEKALSEAKRVCKNNGSIIITVPNMLRINDGAHVWSFNEQEVKELLHTFSSSVYTEIISLGKNVLGKVIINK